MKTSPFRLLYFVTGWLFVALGFVGAILPIMPSTVFFIVAAACFARSSPRFEAWVLNLPGVGALVRDYRAGRGIPRQTKWMIVSIIFLSCALSAWRVPGTIVKLGVGALGVTGIWFVWFRVPDRL